MQAAALSFGSNPPVVAWAALRRSVLRWADSGVDRRRWMDMQQRQVGDFLIYAGALDAPGGGYIAAVEVHRVSEAEGARDDAPEVIFSSERVSGGHRFEAAALALRHALDVGHQAVRLRESLGG
ncbi:MAG: hypothetical protein ABW220_09780 [Burkholderiaceae bacterium]